MTVVAQETAGQQIIIKFISLAQVVLSPAQNRSLKQHLLLPYMRKGVRSHLWFKQSHQITCTVSVVTLLKIRTSFILKVAIVTCQLSMEDLPEEDIRVFRERFTENGGSSPHVSKQQDFLVRGIRLCLLNIQNHGQDLKAIKFISKAVVMIVNQV